MKPIHFSILIVLIILGSLTPLLFNSLFILANIQKWNTEELRWITAVITNIGNGIFVYYLWDKKMKLSALFGVLPIVFFLIKLYCYLIDNTLFSIDFSTPNISLVSVGLGLNFLFYLSFLIYSYARKTRLLLFYALIRIVSIITSFLLFYTRAYDLSEYAVVIGITAIIVLIIHLFNERKKALQFNTKDTEILDI